MKFHNARVMSILLGRTMDDPMYWIKQCKIPIGTLRPFESYEDGKIPDEDIIWIPFDPVNTPLTSRKAMNILLLGGSGDGKSLIMKQIWSVLHEAGFYCGYFDPKSTDSGRARTLWQADPTRKAPFMELKGIPMQHFMPVWATRNYEHMKHNFRLYSSRLKTLNERDMWRGLGVSSIGAARVARIINNMRGKVTIDSVMYELYTMFTESKAELPQASFDNAMRVLNDLREENVVDENYQTINMIEEWRKGNSVAISYNSASIQLMTFDIGMRIKESARYYRTHNNKVPVMWFLDDGSYYLKEHKLVDYNFSVAETLNIGNNYRSLGIYGTVGVQTLGVIDENVSETFKIKIISPLFSNPDSLAKINIPRQAIDYIKDGVLVKDRSRYLFQWILVNEDNEIIPFFPFTPPCNHFREIYFPKDAEEMS